MRKRAASQIGRMLMVIALSGAAILLLQRALIVTASPAISPRSAQPLDVVINEIAWSGTISNSNAEWIELKNNSAITVDLSGWRLYSGDGSPNINLTGIITPGGYFLLERTADTTVSDVPADQIYTGALVDGGESLTLTDEISTVIDAANQNGGTWPAGTNAPKASMERIDSLAPDTDLNWATNDGVTRNGVDIGGNPINGTPRLPNSAKIYIPAVPGSVLISAVHYDGLAASDNDEGVRLTNVSTQPITLTNWVVIYSSSQINLSGTLPPARSIWLAKQAVSFEQQFGFKPDYEYDQDTDPIVPNLTVAGSTPTFGPNAELTLRESGNNYIDAVVWGTGQITNTGWLSGWLGPALQRYSTDGLGATGQLLFRKLDEGSGALISDTNTALDWANDRTDPVSGRKVQYPGWSLEKLWQTAKVTGTATLTVAIAPDNAFRVISDFLGAARQSITMELHTFDNLALARVITEAQARGVSVTILLEGAVPGTTNKIDDNERWVCQNIEAAGGQCWFMINDATNKIYDRYDYVHAKMIVVDGRAVAIGSENFSPRSLVYDDFADGTQGHRGVYLLTNAAGVVSRALDIWRTDFDPARYRDLYRWNISDTTYGPISYTPIFSVEASGYQIRFPQPLTVTGPLTFEVLAAPESALRASDSLLGLINQAGAGDTIDVEQLDEPTHWGLSTGNPIDDPNVRLDALIRAASRGAHVRLLMDRYFDDASRPTSNWATMKYVVALRAISPTLKANLEARLGDPANYGIHNKMFLVNIGGHKWVHAGSLNGTETSNKVNREVALQVESAAAYDYLRPMFEFDWAWQLQAYFPLVIGKSPNLPNYLLISKVFYLGATSVTTGSEWVQIYNPTAITVSLSGYKLGDQAVPGPTGFTFDGMWQFPSNAVIGPGRVVNVATTGYGFFLKYGYPPQYAFYTSDLGVPLMTPYITYTSNFSFSLSNSGDEVLLLGPTDLLVDGVAWGTGALPGNVSCFAIDMNQYPENTPNPSIKREPVWKDTNDCTADFVIDWTTMP